MTTALVLATLLGLLVSAGIAICAKLWFAEGRMMTGLACWAICLIVAAVMMFVVRNTPLLFLVGVAYFLLMLYPVTAFKAKKP